jgi:tetratricopeptide (TPR) repeat protein
MDDRRSVAISQRLRPRLKFFVRCATAVVLLFSSYAGRAQSGRPAPDPTERAVIQAMREGRWVDTETLVTDAIHEIEQNEPNSPRLAVYLEYQSRILDKKGRHPETLALQQRILEIHRNTLGPTNIEISHDLITLASYSRAHGNNQEAERLQSEALEIVRLNMAQLKSGRDVDIAAGVLGSVSSVYLTEHRWAEAKPLLMGEKRLCDFFEVPYRAGSALCGSLPQRLEELYRAEGREADAERVTSDDQDSPRELAALNKTAEQYEKDGLYPSAEDAYNRGIALAERMEANPQNRFGNVVVGEFNLLGQLFEKQGFNDRAEKAYTTALDISEKTADRLSDRGHNDYANVLNFHLLLDLYRREGRLKDIEPVIQRVLELQVKSLGERHRAVVKTLTEFAGVYKEAGKDDEAKYSEARTFYERALTIQQANLGPDDPQLISILTPYADLLRKMHDDAKAAEVQARINVLQNKPE